MGSPFDDDPLFGMPQRKQLIAEVLPRAVDDISAGLPELSRGEFRTAKRGVGAFQGTDRRRLRERLERMQQDRESQLKQGKEVVRLARRSGRPEEAATLRQAILDAKRGQVEAPGMLRSAGAHLFSALDAPHRYGIRSWSTPERVGDKPGEIVSGPEWTKRIREEADKPADSAGRIASKALTGIADTLAYIPGTALGGVVAGVGALGDLAAGNVPGEEIWKNVKQTVGETRRDVGDFAMQVGTDPLSWISGGTAGASKNAGKAALRTALRLGATEEQAAAAAGALERAMVVAGGTQKQNRIAENILRHHLGDQVGRAAFSEAFGQGGEFLGRAQARLHVPFVDRAGVDVAALTGREYAGGKALQRLYEPARTAMQAAGGEARPLFDQTRRIARIMERRKQARINVLKEQFGDELRQISDLAPPTKARRDEIVRGFVDPEAGPGMMTHADLTPKEHDWVNAMSDFFQRRHGDLTKAGVLDVGQFAQNAYSGLYFPRQFSANFGFMADLAPTKWYGAGAGGAGSYKMARRADVPLGGLDEGGVHGVLSYLKGEADPHRVMPRYSSGVASDIGRAELEKEIADAFGQALTEGAGSALKRTRVKMTNSRGLPVEVPADIVKLARQPFESTYETFGNFMRTKGLDATPVGRAALEAIDLYAKAVNRFKRLVLVKVPGYHLVNGWNDTMQMMVDGMANPAKWLKRADDVLLGRGENADLLVRTAKREGIPIDVDAGGRRLDLFGGTGGHALEKEMGAIAREAAGELGPIERFQRARRGLEPRALRAVAAPQRGERLATWWESRAKMAHFLWRLEKGDSPAIAAERTFNVLLDYGHRNRATQVMRWFLPFGTWAAKAPMMTARMVARSPGAVANVGRAFEHLAGPAKWEPARFATERAPSFDLTERGRQVHGRFRQAVGSVFGQPGRPAQPGYGAVVLPRDPFSESLSMPLEVLGRGNLDPLYSSLGPLQKAYLENFAPGGARDLQTKQSAQPTSLSAMFPAGTPFVPKELEASMGIPGGRGAQIPWFSRYAAPFIMDPGTMHLVNRYLYSQGGPVNTLGATRLYADTPEDVLAQQSLGWLTRIPVYETNPLNRIDNLRSQPEAQRRAETLRALAQLRARMQR